MNILYIISSRDMLEKAASEMTISLKISIWIKIIIIQHRKDLFIYKRQRWIERIFQLNEKKIN